MYLTLYTGVPLLPTQTARQLLRINNNININISTMQVGLANSFFEWKKQIYKYFLILSILNDDSRLLSLMLKICVGLYFPKQKIDHESIRESIKNLTLKQNRLCYWYQENLINSHLYWVKVRPVSHPSYGVHEMTSLPTECLLSLATMSRINTVGWQDLPNG